MRDLSWFVSICATNGLQLTYEQAEEFEKYRHHLISWNRRVNLISRKDEDNFYSNHALNCISFLFSRKLKRDATILDLGTGGGLPGIPLKIVLPELNLTLLDSIAKKTKAVSEIVSEMAMKGVTVVTGRAEELAKTREFQGKFDYVIARAAGKLDEVARWSRGFLRDFQLYGDEVISAGMLLVLKGGSFEDELTSARRIKFVKSVEANEILFTGMDELENKEKKLVLVIYEPLPPLHGGKI